MIIFNILYKDTHKDIQNVFNASFIIHRYQYIIFSSRVVHSLKIETMNTHLNVCFYLLIFIYY